MYMENRNSGFYRKVWTYLRWIYYYLQGKISAYWSLSIILPSLVVLTHIELKI